MLYVTNLLLKFCCQTFQHSAWRLDRYRRLNLVKMLSKETVPTDGTDHGHVAASTGKPYTVAIEGNIASGKTTFLNYFRGIPQVQVFEEPVERWQDVHGHNLLQKTFSGPSRWGLTFQTYVQRTMLDIHKEPQSAPVKIMERSIFSGRYCFVENLHRSKVIEEIEYAILSDLFDSVLKTEKVDVDLIVYLQSTPEICYERMRTRNRSEECDIPLSYVEGIHELHEEWLIKQTSFKVPAPVLCLDANVPLEQMSELIDLHKDKILLLDLQ